MVWPYGKRDNFFSGVTCEIEAGRPARRAGPLPPLSMITRPVSRQTTGTARVVSSWLFVSWYCTQQTDVLSVFSKIDLIIFRPASNDYSFARERERERERERMLIADAVCCFIQPLPTKVLGKMVHTNISNKKCEVLFCWQLMHPERRKQNKTR